MFCTAELPVATVARKRSHKLFSLLLLKLNKHKAIKQTKIIKRKTRLKEGAIMMKRKKKRKSKRRRMTKDETSTEQDKFVFITWITCLY